MNISEEIKSKSSELEHIISKESKAFDNLDFENSLIENASKSIMIPSQTLYTDPRNSGYFIRIITDKRVYIYPNDTLYWRTAIQSTFKTDYPSGKFQINFKFLDRNNNLFTKSAYIGLFCFYDGSSPSSFVWNFNHMKLDSGTYERAVRLGLSYKGDPDKCPLI